MGAVVRRSRCLFCFRVWLCSCVLFCGFWLFAALWTLSESPNETQAQPRLRGTQVAAPGSTLATLDIQENDAVRAVGCSAWLGVFISAPAKSTPTRIELYPREFVFCPYRGLRVKGLRIIERRYRDLLTYRPFKMSMCKD